MTIVNSVAVETALFQGYQLRLPAFEGPFDVLLRLVERSHLLITDVSLIDVTNQFLDYVAAMDTRDPALVAEFSTVGSRLVVLKSRSLLPKPPIEDVETVSDLARELIEYQAYKDMAAHLRDRDVLGEGAFPLTGAQLPPSLPQMDRVLAAHQPNQLVRALRRRLAVLPTPALIVAARKLVSLRDMAERVLHALGHTGSTTFRNVLARCSDYHEVRTAFLAVLVLSRRDVVEVEQTELFGEISIKRHSAFTDNDSFLKGLVLEDRMS